MVISGGHINSAAYDVWKGFDGNYDYTKAYTYWAGLSGANWCLLELPYPIKIKSIRFHHRTASDQGNTKTVQVYAGKNINGHFLGDCICLDGVAPYYQDMSVTENRQIYSKSFYFNFPDYYGLYAPILRMVEITAVYKPGVVDTASQFICDSESRYFIKY